MLFRKAIKLLKELVDQTVIMICKSTYDNKEACKVLRNS